jgi:DNA-binding CsgD family transcriptional regulator
MGTACAWMWGYLCYLSPLLLPPSAGNTMWPPFVFGCAMVVLCMLFGLRYHTRISRLVHGHETNTLLYAGLFTSFSIVLLWASSMRNWMPGMIAAALLASTPTLFFTALWGERFVALGARSLGVVTIVSYLILCLFYLLFSLFSWVPLAVVVIAIPTLSAVFYRFDVKSHTPHGSVSCTEKESASCTDTQSVELGGERFSWRGLSASGFGLRMFAPYLIVAIVGNVASSMLLSYSYVSASVVIYSAILAAVALCVVGLLAIVISGHRVSFRFFYLSVAMLTTAALLVLSHIDQTPPAWVPSFGFMLGGCFSLQVVFWWACGFVAERGGMATVPAFLFGQAVNSATIVIGQLTGKVLVWWLTDPAFLGALSLIIVFIVFAAVIFTLTADNPWSETAQVEPAVDTVIAEDPLAYATGITARRQGLSPREEQVLGYIVHGRSAPYIAKELVVSTGTVKTHFTHIYRKLGVNSKQAVIDVVNKDLPEMRG